MKYRYFMLPFIIVFLMILVIDYNSEIVNKVLIDSNRTINYPFFDNDNIETDMFSLFFDFNAILENTGLKMPLFKVYNVPVKNLIDCNFLDFDKYQNYWHNSAICRSADGGFYALLN